mmetsp:Transcript_13892/g.23024  ORF Transcript_13892/g.23024 Transcript_13892/m.23024 type:complete len:374 (+) Transcript_13892:170-1291(+)
MSSNDFNEMKKEMDSAVPKSKLNLIKKRVARGSSQSSVAGTVDRRGSEEVIVRKAPPPAQLRQQLCPPPPQAHDRDQPNSRPPAAPMPQRGTHFRTTSGECEKVDHVTDPGSQLQPRPDIKSFSQPIEKDTPPISTSQATSSLSNKKPCIDEGAVKSISGTKSNTNVRTSTSTSTSTASSASPAMRCSVQWLCQECSPPHACIPVRSESRCLCGHRYKEHKMQPPRPGEEVRPENVRYKCGSKGCACKHFFFIVAEGAWILRCRCKHKHIEHDCGSPPFKCKKPRCSCNGFDSPWVCNCGHPWSSHQQRVVQAAQPTGLIAEALEMHRREALAGGGSEKAATGGADLTDMVGLLTDGSAMRDLDMNVRRDGHS